MTRPAQHLAVADILLACLALVGVGALGARPAGPAAASGPVDLARFAPLDPVPEPGDPGSRETRIRAGAGAAPGAPVPEGLALLFLAVTCALTLTFVSTTPGSHPARRALARESRRWRCVR